MVEKLRKEKVKSHRRELCRALCSWNFCVSVASVIYNHDKHSTDNEQIIDANMEDFCGTYRDNFSRKFTRNKHSLPDRKKS